MALTRPAPSTVAALSCRGCGAPLELRAPGRSLAVACGACGAVLDARDPDHRLIARYQAQPAAVPRIPLGTRGRLEGEPWEVIGYLVRRTTIEGQAYSWFEHLLHHPTGGFRWLVEYNGHWTLTRTAAGVPEAGPATSVTYLGERYRHFQTAEAEVAYVVGEFPWRVRVGERATVDDYVRPPAILSRERTPEDTTWSVGEYLRGEAVWRAFGLPGAPPEPIGVGAAQPSPYTPHSRRIGLLTVAFLALAALIQLLFTFFAQQRLVLDAAWEYHPRVPATASVQSAPFVISGRASNLLVEISTSLSQGWGYFTVTLVNEETGTGRTFGREVAYYFGHDGDGQWSEGAPWDRVWLSAVPAGRYLVLVEPESPQPVNYRVRVTRDVPRALWLWLAMGVLAAPPLFFWWRQWGFEYRRWQESDHPMGGRPAGDEGGDDE